MHEVLGLPLTPQTSINCIVFISEVISQVT